MRRLFAAGCAGCVLVAAGAPAAAGARATITIDGRCFRAGADTIDVRGTGFAAGSAFQSTLDGRPLHTGTVGGDGHLRDRFRAPGAGRAGERSIFLGVTDGPASTSLTFLVTRFSASFAPQSGDPRTLRVHFTLLGFGPGTAYLHWVDPGGSVRRTATLGRTRGACGHLTTGSRRIFPFPARVGSWRLQFDLRRRYSAAAVPRYPLVVPLQR